MRTLIAYFPSDFAFQHQQNLVAFFVRLGFVTGRIARRERHHRGLTPLTRLQNFKPMFRLADVSYVHASNLPADHTDFAHSIFVRASRRDTPAVVNPARFALSGIARVPIHLTCHVHYDRQNNEERDCAHEQGIILLP